MTKYALLDFETTGLDTAESKIISVSLFRYSHGKLVGRIDKMINPHEHIDIGLSLDVHGISDNHVKNADDFFDVGSEILDELSKTDVVVTFNGERYDLQILLAECKRNGLDVDTIYNLKSLDLYRVAKQTLNHVIPAWKENDSNTGFSQRNVYYHLFGSYPEGEHQANSDVKNMRKIMTRMKTKYNVDLNNYLIDIVQIPERVNNVPTYINVDQIFQSGKFINKTIRELLDDDYEAGSKYISWMNDNGHIALSPNLIKTISKWKDEIIGTN